ncbi:MAG: DUF1385 domain-containing protein [Lachnospiraceae bacterium]|nr:DUF1385 domain-containing protein [Lachnospiraceae bacterium]
MRKALTNLALQFLRDKRKDRDRTLAKKRKRCYSGIGGQAVLEGIMMKNKNAYAVAVRLPNGKITVDRQDISGSISSGAVGKVPFVRGVFTFVDSMILGMKTLTYSASFYEEEEETKGDGVLNKIFKEKTEDVVMGFTVCISMLLAIGLFMFLPYLISELVSRWILNDSLIAIIEGVVRILIFVLYVLLISLMKDIRRLYQYHGAEHKCINCIESGRELTVRNVMRCSRLHRRCGTSFMLIVMCISIILFFFIRTDSMLMRIVYRLLLIPVVAGISYEILRLAGRSDNLLVRIISAPGMWLQKITTREPEPDMVEVAIAAIEAVFDWRAFEEKRFGKKTAPAEEEQADIKKGMVSQ